MIKVKKFALLFMVAAAGAVPVFADSTHWLSLGFELGNYFDSYKLSGDVYKLAGLDGAKAKTSLAAMPGIALDWYDFFGTNRKVGLFTHFGFLFPQKYKQEIEGIKSESDFSTAFFVGLIIGPGFRAELSDKLKMHFGLGFSFEEMFMEEDEMGVDIIEVDYVLGLGGDIGLKIDVANGFYIDFGTLLTLDFARYSNMGALGTQVFEGWLKSYVGGSIRPYIRAGINLYRENGATHFGKARSTGSSGAGKTTAQVVNQDDKTLFESRLEKIEGRLDKVEARLNNWQVAQNDKMPAAKGVLTITGLDNYEGKYVYVSGRVDGVVLTGLADVINYSSVKDAKYKLVKIIDGTAVVPMYKHGVDLSSAATAFVAYNGSDAVSGINVVVYDDGDGLMSADDLVNGTRVAREKFSGTFSNGNLTVAWQD